VCADCAVWSPARASRTGVHMLSLAVVSCYLIKFSPQYVHVVILRHIRSHKEGGEGSGCDAAALR